MAKRPTTAERFPVGSKVRYVGDNDGTISKVWAGMHSADLTVDGITSNGYVSVLRNGDPEDWFIIEPGHLVTAEGER